MPYYSTSHNLQQSHQFAQIAILLLTHWSLTQFTCQWHTTSFVCVCGNYMVFMYMRFAIFFRCRNSEASFKILLLSNIASLYRCTQCSLDTCTSLQQKRIKIIFQCCTHDMGCNCTKYLLSSSDVETVSQLFLQNTIALQRIASLYRCTQCSLDIFTMIKFIFKCLQNSFFRCKKVQALQHWIMFLVISCVCVLQMLSYCRCRNSEASFKMGCACLDALQCWSNNSHKAQWFLIELHCIVICKMLDAVGKK